jgi:hypothetical protein
MSRELKFRVWDDHTKSFFTRIDFADANKGDGIGNNVIMFPVYPSREYVFQQFTGLKDSNGKEIYEGDILKWERYPYGGPFSSVYWVSEDDGWDFSGWMIKESENQRGKCEIVGNIFENPELIKNGNK